MKRRLLSLILALVMMLSLMTGLAVTTYADGEQIIASWATSFPKDTAVQPTSHDSNNGGATLQSNKAITTSGQGMYYGSSAGGATITINGLDTSGYSDKVTLSFGARASKGGTITVTSGSFSTTTTGLKTSGTPTTYTIDLPVGITSITLSHSATSGSLYFGNVELSGIPATSGDHTHSTLTYTHVDGTSGAESKHTINCQNANCPDYPKTEDCSFTTQVVAPTYENGGYTRHICSLCGYYYDTDITSALTPITLYKVTGSIPAAATKAVIYYTTQGKAVGTSIVSSQYYYEIKAIDVAVSNNTIVNPDPDAIWNIVQNSTYAFKNNNDEYLTSYNSNNYHNVTIGETGNYDYGHDWTFSEGTLKSNANVYMGWHSSYPYFYGYDSAQSGFEVFTDVASVTNEHTAQHTVEHVQAVAATCTNDGHVEYYHCTEPTCVLYGKYYSDSSLQTELDSIVVSATGHDFDNATWTDNGDGTCSADCANQCGESSTLAHTWNSNDVCERCGAQKPAAVVNQYVIAAKIGDTYYALPSPFSISNGKIAGVEIAVVGGVVNETVAADYTVTIETLDNYSTIQDANGYYLGYSGNTNLNRSDTVDDSHRWIITNNNVNNGSYSITNVGTDTRGLIFRSGSNVFGAYSTSNVTATGTEYYNIELLPISGINKAALINAIASAQAKIESDYTADSWAALATALAAAQSIAAKADATQQEVDDAASALTTAINNLVRLHNYKTIYVINNIDFQPADLHVYLWKDGSNNNNNWPGPALTAMTDYAVGEGTAHTSNGDKAFYSFQVDLVEYDRMIFNWGENQAQTGNLDLTASDPVYYINDGELGNANSVTTSNDVFLTANYVNTATCESAGYEYYTGLISSENHSSETPVAALGHDWNNADNGHEGWVANGDNTHSRTCARCQKQEDGDCSFTSGVCDTCGGSEVVNPVYQKVTSEPTNWTGEYLLVYEQSDSTAYVFGGVDAPNGYIEATNVTDNRITYKQGMAKIIISEMEGGYSLQITGTDDANNNDQYLYGTSGKNETHYSSTPQLNTIELNNGNAIITSNTSFIQFNSNSDQMRFRYYKSGTTSQQGVQLYKLVEADVSVSLTTESSDSGAIVLNYYIQNAPKLATAKVFYNFEGEDVEASYAAQEDLSNSISAWTDAGTNGIKISVPVPMKNFKNNVILKLYDDQGNQFGESGGYSYCVQNYLNDAGAQSTDAELLDLLDSINYLGRTAEALFNNNKVDTEFANAKAAIDAIFTNVNNTYKTGVTVTGTGFWGSSLVLEDQVTLRFYFTVGEGYTVVGSGESLTKSGSDYYYDVTGIAAKDLDKGVTVSITNGTDTVTVANFSPLTYATMVINDSANQSEALVYLCKALYVYQAAAAVYFG